LPHQVNDNQAILDIRHDDLAMRVPPGIAAAGPMAARGSITAVGQGARGAPRLSWRGPVGKIVRVFPLVATRPCGDAAFMLAS